MRNTISPQQRGYRDGWRAPHDPRLAIANAPYLYGTANHAEWLKAFLEARADRAAGNTQ
jgi:hypothetical protein